MAGSAGLARVEEDMVERIDNDLGRVVCGRDGLGGGGCAEVGEEIREREKERDEYVVLEREVEPDLGNDKACRGGDESQKEYLSIESGSVCVILRYELTSTTGC